MLSFGIKGSGGSEVEATLIPLVIQLVDEIGQGWDTGFDGLCEGRRGITHREVAEVHGTRVCQSNGEHGDESFPSALRHRLGGIVLQDKQVSSRAKVLFSG